MEKLGVVQQKPKDEKEKTAGKNRVCPDCGRELIEDNQYLLLCSVCGTKPFEDKNG